MELKWILKTIDKYIYIIWKLALIFLISFIHLSFLTPESCHPCSRLGYTFWVSW